LPDPKGGSPPEEGRSEQDGEPVKEDTHDIEPEEGEEQRTAKRRDRYDEAWRRYRREMRRFKREKRVRVINIPWGKLAIVAVAVILVGIAFLLVTTLPLAAPPPTEEPKAPNFSLTAYNGTKFFLSDFDGEVVLLDFMSTTCTPCIEEIYDIKIVRDTYPGQFVIISISVARESDSTLQSFAQLHGIDWLLAADTAEENVAGKYGVRYTPTLFILDQERHIRYKHILRTPAEVLSSEIGELLGQGKDADEVAGRNQLDWMVSPFSPAIHSLIRRCLEVRFRW